MVLILSVIDVKLEYYLLHANNITNIYHPDFIGCSHEVKQKSRNSCDDDDGQVSPLCPLDGNEANEENVDRAHQRGSRFDRSIVNVVSFTEIIFVVVA
jgi:hypothetical protein